MISMSFKISKKILLSLIVVFLFSLFISRSLFTNLLPRTDDLELHGARVASYYLALKQGQLPVYWGPNLYYGFGYPVFLFSYQFPYILATLFYVMGFSIEISLNILLIIFITIGGLGIFYLSYLLNKNIYLAIISSFIYQTSPYILLNTFVRGALGEIAFLSLFPWVFVMLILRKHANKWWYLFFSVLIFTSLILSHPVSLLVAMPIIVFWLIFNGYYSELKNVFKNKNNLNFIFSCLLSIGISSFYWIPFIFEKKNIVIASHSIINNFSLRFMSLSQIFFSKWGYGGADLTKLHDVFPATLGFSIIFIVMYSFFKIFNKYKLNKLNKTFDKNIFFWLIIFFVAVFLMLSISINIWNFSKILPYLQYPWRLFWVTVFSGVMILNSLKSINRYLLILLLLISFHHAIYYAKPLSYIHNSDHDWLEYFGTSTSDNELKPKWFDENKNIGIENKIVLNSENDNKKITSLLWTGSKISYQIYLEEPTQVIQKTMYFPGWEVYIDGNKTEIDYQTASYPGRILYSVPPGSHQIISKFTNNTYPRKIGIYFTLISTSTWMLLVIFAFFNKKLR